MESKPNGKDNPTIHTCSWHYTACHTQSATAAVLCTAAIAKPNREDNPVQGIIAIGAFVDIWKVVKC